MIDIDEKLLEKKLITLTNIDKEEYEKIIEQIISKILEHDNFMKEVGALWKENVPDWRFGQLIVNLIRYTGRDPFFWEEDDFLNKLRDYFSTLQ